MNVEQDYIMRMIKEFANVLGRLLFNKKKPMYELDVTNRYHVGDDLYTRLCRMADEGKINETENLLYTWRYGLSGDGAGILCVFELF